MIWTSMWMHESLETFAYRGRLPFDPHCEHRLKPISGGFFTDNECSEVEVHELQAGLENIAQARREPQAAGNLSTYSRE